MYFYLAAKALMGAAKHVVESLDNANTSHIEATGSDLALGVHGPGKTIDEILKKEPAE